MSIKEKGRNNETEVRCKLEKEVKEFKTKKKMQKDLELEDLQTFFAAIEQLSSIY